MRCSPGTLLALACVTLLLALVVIAGERLGSTPEMPPILTARDQTPLARPPRANPSPTMVPFLTHGSPAPVSYVQVPCQLSRLGCPPARGMIGP